MSRTLIPIRQSHLLSHSGVGAIVRWAEGLVTVQDIRQWTDRHGNITGEPIPYVERVRATLNIEGQLRQPPVAQELANGQVDGVCVPAMRFPSWMHCAACGALYRSPWRNIPVDGVPCCTQEYCNRHPKLEQVTWVLADPAGHLADVPWHYLAHKSARAPAQSSCRIKDQLQLIELDYDMRVLRCRACGSEARFHGDERIAFGQGRIQPWTREDRVPPQDADGNGNEALAQVLAVNDARVYSPSMESVLVIPPESRVRKGTVVDRLYRSSNDRQRIDSARTQLARKSAIQTLASDYRCTSEELEEALTDIDNGYPLYGNKPTPGQLRESEFRAFLEVLPDQREDEDLVIHNLSDDWCQLKNKLDAMQQILVSGVRHLVRVDRLKAVMVSMGFSRLGGEEIVPPDIVGSSDWLPAVELYGEGIFLALDEDRLASWEQKPAVIARLDRLLPRYTEATRVGRDRLDSLTPRFMLLHTLSHLLMRQIETECGYPAASLIERIYCATDPEPMAGVLIHVAVPDIAGSLGGLAELAHPWRFLGILVRALEHAHRCSLDPVCSEHEGQGPGLLNRAACHACALVPEPACEYGNTLLDRGFVKGDSAGGLPPFFGMGWK